MNDTCIKIRKIVKETWEEYLLKFGYKKDTHVYNIHERDLKYITNIIDSKVDIYFEKYRLFGSTGRKFPDPRINEDFYKLIQCWNYGARHLRRDMWRDNGNQKQGL